MIGDDGDVDGQLMTVVIGTGGDDVHAVLSVRAGTLNRYLSPGVYYSSRTTKSDDSVTRKCWSNIDTQKDACFRPCFAMQPIIRDRPRFTRNVIYNSSSPTRHDGPPPAGQPATTQGMDRARWLTYSGLSCRTALCPLSQPPRPFRCKGELILD